MATTRRQLLCSLALLGLPGLVLPRVQASVKPARLVVIGGGFGGATAARTLNRLLPAADVTLVEPAKNYVACPFSNLVVAGQRDISDQTFSYAALAGEGIRVAQDSATDVDPLARTVRLGDGTKLPYDRPASIFVGAISRATTRTLSRRCPMPGRQADRPRCCAISSERCRTTAPR